MFFIGREKEIKVLEEKINSIFREIVVLYGRRRIGKTETTKLLIDKYSEDNVVLHFTGKMELNKKEMILDLKESLINQISFSTFFKKNKINFSFQLIQKINNINSTYDFFNCLQILYLELNEIFKFDKNPNIKFIILFDEISYLDKYSGFWKNFTSQWNGFYCYHNNIKFLLTGSVVFWLKRNINSNKDDFYNRITHEIHLKPFSLLETKEYFYKNFKFFNDKEILLYHMIFGGIPYYFSLIDPKLDLKTNVANLFSRNGRLFNEYKNLCLGLFSEKRDHKKILEILALNKNKAYSIKELEILLNKNKLYEDIKELEDCYLIKSNFNFKNNQKEVVYSISDPFVYFYLNYLSKNNFKINDSNFNICCGYLFELFCFNNIDLICEKLGIGGLKENIKSFYFRNEKSQIDLLLRRPDNIITLVECKFYNKEFIINDNFIKEINNKKNELLNSSEFKNFKNFNIQVVVITLNGVKISKENILNDGSFYNYITF